jgi:hypothetical protein
MSAKEILQAKEIVKKVAQESACSLGLLNGDGTWLCPLSEDHIFFLLQLDGIVAEGSLSVDPFPYMPKSISRVRDYIVFTRNPLKTPLNLPYMACIPTDSFDRWKVEEGSFSQVIKGEGLLERIKDKEYLQTETKSEKVKPYEKERLGFLLLLSAFLIYRFRKAIPLMTLLFFCHGLLLGEASFQDENYLASSLSESGETTQAKRYLKQKYMTEVLEAKRSSFAFNLSLLSARSQNFKEALFWFKKIDSQFLSRKEVRDYACDLLSSIILEGDSSSPLEMKAELQSFMKMGAKIPWYDASLLYTPTQKENHFFYGLSSLSQRVISPALLFMEAKEKKEMIQILKMYQKEVFLECKGRSLFFLKNEFEKALYENDIERLSLLLELFSCSTTIEKMERLIDLGIREARLFSFFQLWSEERQQTGLWMRELFLGLSEKSLYDIRLKGRDGTALFRAAWDIGGSFQHRWERLLYLERVLRQDEVSPLRQGVLFLNLISCQNNDKSQLLALLLEWLGFTGIENKSDIDATLTSFLKVWMDLEPNDVLATLADRQSLQELVDAIEKNSEKKTLLTFFHGCSSFTLEFEEMKKSPILLLHVSSNLVTVMKNKIESIPNYDQLMREAIELVKGVHSLVEPQLTTKQEKSIAGDLLEKIQEASLEENLTPQKGKQILFHIGKILALLEHVLEQKDPNEMLKNRNEDLKISSKNPVGTVDEEKAVQMVLELEREEREMKKR